MSTYQKVCEAKTKQEMQKQFDLLVAICVKKYPTLDRNIESQRQLQLSNVGYFSGYYDSKVFDRVHKWLGAVHPVFGKKYPTPEEAFKHGESQA